MTGVATSSLPAATVVEDLLGNSGGNTRRISIDRLVALIAALMGPTYSLRSQLFADLNWPAGSIGYVRADGTAAFNGVYKKSGSSGSGSWSRIGDLPSGAIELSLIDEAVASLNSFGTRFYGSRADAEAQAQALPSGITQIIVREGTALVVRSRPSSSDDPLYASGTRWGVVQRHDTASLLARMTVPLGVVAGTASAITAEIPASLVLLGQGDIAEGQEFTFTPAAPNPAENPTIRVDRPAAGTASAVTGTARSVRGADGQAWPAGAFVPDRTYTLRRVGTLYRVVRGGVTQTELAAEAAARAVAIRGANRRVFSRNVTVSASEIVVRLPPDVQATIDANTLIDILWPDAPWPVGAGTNITLRVEDSAGNILRGRNARLDRATGPGPTPGAWWTITEPASGVGEWVHVVGTPTQADVDSRARLADTTARFDASLLAARRVIATRDTSVTNTLRLVIPDEGTAGPISIVIPEDGPGPGLSITTPTRTRTVGLIVPPSNAPSSSGMRYRAGDVVTLQIFDNNWFRLLHAWVSPRTVADLQTRLAAEEAETAYLRANSQQVVEQLDGNWPNRPANVGYVVWYGPDSPGARMRQGADTWVQTPAPTLPGIPAPEELRSIRLTGRLAGVATATLANEIPRQYPQLTSVQLQVNNGAWQTLFARPFTAGRTSDLPALPVGDHTMRVRYLNYIGPGEPGPERLYRSHNAIFEEDFTLQFAWAATDGIRGRDNWHNPIWSGNAQDNWRITDDGGATGTVANNRSRALVSWDDISAVGGAGLMVEGRIRRTTGATRFIALTLSTLSDTRTNLIRLGKDGDLWTLDIGETQVASGSLPQPGAEYLGRIEVPPSGATIRAYADGQLVAEVANTLQGGPLLIPGMFYQAPPAPQVSGTATISNFRTGRISA